MEQAAQNSSTVQNPPKTRGKILVHFIVSVLSYVFAMVLSTIIIVTLNSFLSDTVQTTIQFIPTNVIAVIAICLSLAAISRISFTDRKFQIFFILSILLSGYYSFNQIVLFILLALGIQKILKIF